MVGRHGSKGQDRHGDKNRKLRVLSMPTSRDILPARLHHLNLTKQHHQWKPSVLILEPKRDILFQTTITRIGFLIEIIF